MAHALEDASPQRELSGGTVIWLFVAIELLTFGLFFVAVIVTPEPAGPERNREARLLLATWLVLLAATAGSFWIAGGRAAPGAATAGLVIGIAAAKANLVAGIFMELLRAPRIWAVAMSGFLLAQAVLIVALFP